MAGLLSPNGLSAYLDQAARTPFAWGGLDCLLFPAGWVRRATGIDPAAAYRGRYRTALGAARLIARAGGFLGIVAQGMDGFDRTEDPRPGDVGIIRAAGCEPGSDQAGAIRVDGRWCVIWAGGLWFGTPETVAAWQVLGQGGDR